MKSYKASLVRKLARRWVTAFRHPPLSEMGIGWSGPWGRNAEAPCRECDAVWDEPNVD